MIVPLALQFSSNDSAESALEIDSESQEGSLSVVAGNKLVVSVVLASEPALSSQ